MTAYGTKQKLCDVRFVSLATKQPPKAREPTWVSLYKIGHPVAGAVNPARA